MPNPQQAKEIQKFCEKILKGKGVQKIKKTPLNAPSTNYCQMIQEIAEVQRFEVSYMDITELSVSGRFSLIKKYMLIKFLCRYLETMKTTFQNY